MAELMHQTTCHLIPLQPDHSLQLARRNEEEGACPFTPPSPTLPHYTLIMPGKHGDESLNAKGQIGKKACLVTTDTGASVTIARLDIITELLERPHHVIHPS
jgi:hypothetical protein